MHDAIPARDREATGDSFTNRAITLHTRTAVYMHVVVPEYKNRKIYAYILRKLNIYFEQVFLYSVIVTVHFR